MERDDETRSLREIEDKLSELAGIPDPTDFDIVMIDDEEQNGEKEQKEKKTFTNKYVTDSYQLYLNDVNATQTRLLSREEEKWLGEQKNKGDIKALKTLANFNLKLVINIAMRWYRPDCGVQLLDVIQNGNMGLMKAALKFDPSKGFKFSTYATYWIRQAIARQTPKQAAAINYPVQVHENIRKLTKVTAKYTQEHGHEPSIEELSELTGFDAESIRDYWKILQGTISLDAPFHEDDEDFEGNLLSKLPMESEDAPYERTARILMMEDLRKLMKILDDRAYKIIILRFGLDGGEGMKLEDISKELGITKERVRQIIAESLKKIKNSKDSVTIASYLDLGDGVATQ